MESDFNEIYGSKIETNGSPRKRVLFIVTQSELGGAQQFLVELVTQLDKSKFEFSVAVGKDGYKEILGLFPSEVEVKIIPALLRNPSLLKDIRSIYQIKKLITSYQPDILFLNSSKAGFNGSWAAKLARNKVPEMRVIYRIGGWTFKDPWPGWKKYFFTQLEKNSAPWKDYIIVNNMDDLNSAKKAKIKPRKEVVLIHNGIDPYIEIYPKEEAKLKLFDKIAHQNLSKNKGGQAELLKAEFIAGTIANFYPSKNVIDLVRAAQKTPDNIKFVVIGDGEMRPQIEEEIERLDLSKKVYLAGRFQARKYMLALDIFVLPSLKEGFPWTVLEAIAAKIPVIATSVGVIPEIIESGKNGIIVSPGRPEEIAEAIKTLIENEFLRKEIPIQAHQNLIKNFSIRQMVDKYEELFLRD